MVTAGEAEATRRRLPAGRPAGGSPAAAGGQPRADIRPWDGTWELATVDGDTRRPAADRADAPRCARRPAPRRAPRGRLGAAGQPRPGPLGRRGRRWSTRWCVRWTGARPDPAPDVASAFGLAAWSTTARTLRDEIAGLLPPLERGDAAALRRRVHHCRPRCCATSRPTRCSRTRSSRRAGRAPRSARSTTATTPPTGPRCGPGSAPRGDQRAPVATFSGDLSRVEREGSPENDAATSAGRGGGRLGSAPTSPRRAGSGRGRSG